MAWKSRVLSSSDKMGISKPPLHTLCLHSICAGRALPTTLPMKWKKLEVVSIDIGPDRVGSRGQSPQMAAHFEKPFNAPYVLAYLAANIGFGW